MSPYLAYVNNSCSAQTQKAHKKSELEYFHLNLATYIKGGSKLTRMVGNKIQKRRGKT